MLPAKRICGKNSADRVCRLCSSNSGIIVLNIFDGEGRKRRILSLINACLPVKVSENDPLPKVICHHCLHKLEVFREFQENCLKSEETLRSGVACSVTYPAFRNASREFIQENEETLSRFSAELVPLPDPLLHRETSDAVAAAAVAAESDERSEESTVTVRRDSFEYPHSDQLEVIMVKQEPEERSAEAEEDTEWHDSNIETDNTMETEEADLSLLPPDSEIKAELCPTMESPVIRIERDFIVTQTNRGKRCLLRGQYKYRKARETRAGFVIWRCTNSNCSALLKTDIGCTTLYNSRSVHNHKEISWQKLARNVFSKACKCKRWGTNSSFLCTCLPSSSNSEPTSNNQYYGRHYNSSNSAHSSNNQYYGRQYYNNDYLKSKAD